MSVEEHLMLTKFGLVTRKLRLDRELRLRDMADLLQLSSAFVSAIETGRKPIPDDYVAAVCRVLAASNAETRDLRQAADEARTSVHVGKLDGADRALIASFARNFKELPPEILDGFRKLLAQYTGPETTPPKRRIARKISISNSTSKNNLEFGRSFQNTSKRLRVEAISAPGIVESAHRLRRQFIGGEQLWFPIVEFLELIVPKIIPFNLDVCDLLTIGGEEGKYVYGTNTIMVREDVYEAACEGVGWARFVLGHEFGHFWLHRLQPRPRTSGRYSMEKDPEWQSNTFSGSLHMSPEHLELFQDATDAAIKCGMSRAAAEVTWSQLSQLKVGGELRFLDRFEEIHNSCGTISKPPLHKSDNEGARKQPRVFVIHGHDPCHQDLDLFLQRIGVKPLFFDQLPKTGSATIVELLETYIPGADAAIVLLTPDDEGRKRGTCDLELRARQNVLIEAGYAVIARRISTVLVALGGVCIPSDFEGIHRIEAQTWTSAVASKIAKRLLDMNLAIDFSAVA